ncbi:hypothetical protein [Halorhodospira halophila]|uniref:hypothetical protein n=1 Tax=Halorhodospira halophila TaxID=1053 RepID=UPI0019130037|nr:hypothetical protein [Halorhodospira halophila]MBK5942728.1 hypothetical protein [Halorhodospira halophila]
MTDCRYRVVRPNAGIVSNHRKLDRALESLERQRRGARQQGGYCDDYIERWDDTAGRWATWHEPADVDPQREARSPVWDW